MLARESLVHLVRHVGARNKPAISCRAGAHRRADRVRLFQKREEGRSFVNPEAPDVSVPLWPLITHLIRGGHTRVAIELLTRALVRYDMLR